MAAVNCTKRNLAAKMKISTPCPVLKPNLKLGWHAVRLSLVEQDFLGLTYCRPVRTVTVRLPLNNNVSCDTDFPVNITRGEFFEYIFSNMALDAATAELGWRSYDESKYGPVHRLATDNSDDLRGAFRTLLRKQNQSRRRQEAFMEIIHLVCFACFYRATAC